MLSFLKVSIHEFYIVKIAYDKQPPCLNNTLSLRKDIMATSKPSVNTITAQELPLICTGPVHETWNGHPRVFLPIQSNSSIECPYCGKQYHLEGIADNHH